MTFEELQNTLNDAMAGGKIGTPVSMTLRLQLADPHADLIESLVSAVQLARDVLASSPLRLAARRDESRHQLNVLINYEDGQTVLATAGCGSVGRSEMHLLLVGNRGVMRLEGGELFEETPALHTSGTKRLQTAIVDSLSRNDVVVIEHDA